MTVKKGLPGLVGHDHTGLTVPNLDEAIDFFDRVLGCTHVLTFGPIGDPEGSFMTDALGVHPRARIERVAMIRCGNGSNLELFEYSAPTSGTSSKRTATSAPSTSPSTSATSRPRRPIWTRWAWKRGWGRCRSRTARSPGSRSFTSRRPGVCSSRRSAIRRGWRMRRRVRCCCGIRRSRGCEVAIASLHSMMGSFPTHAHCLTKSLPQPPSSRT